MTDGDQAAETQTPREGFERFTSHLREVAASALAKGDLAPTEVKQFEFASIYLDHLPPEIMEALTEEVGPDRLDDFFYWIWLLTTSAYLVGSRGTVSETASHLAQLRSAANARNLDWRKRRKAAVIEILRTLPASKRAKSLENAELIRDQVRSRLPDEWQTNDYPTAHTLRNLIIEIS